MADPIIAVAHSDRASGRTTVVTDGERGLEAVRYFRVNTGDPVLWYNATGLPRRGDSFPGLANLLVVSRTPTPAGGKDDGSDNAWTFVEVRYAEQTLTADFQAQEGESFSEFSSSTQQLQVIADADGNPVPPSSREANTAEIRVTAYSASIAAVQAFIGIQNRINGNAVQIPALKGFLGAGLVAAPGQLLARTVAVTPVRDGLAKLTYSFGYGQAGAFRLSYRLQDKDGNPTGPVLNADIQGTVNFPGPGVLW